MTEPSAEVIADSISPAGIRLTTMRIKLHRFVLAELNTHRMFSRNFRSSRAVPTRKLIEEVRNHPAMPVFWGKNQSGMQAAEEIDDVLQKKGWLVTERGYCKKLWQDSAVEAARAATLMMEAGVHKQVVNRVLEPYLWCYGVVTATEWDNFFGLRLHKDAQPEMRALAEAMWKARKESTPRSLRCGTWHLPFIDYSGEETDTTTLEYRDEDKTLSQQTAIKVSAARCARVSYHSFETGKRSTVEEDLALYDKLMGAQPFHASPTEHQATPDVLNRHLIQEGWLGYWEDFWEHNKEHGNFKGWRQYRKMIPLENLAPLPEDYK